MDAESQSVIEGPQAMVVERSDIVRNLRQIIIRIFLGPNGAAPEERHPFIEDPRIAG
jgi:hypothetical protein